MRSQFAVKRRTPAYWRITFHNPPINLLDPDTTFELLTLMDQIEADPDLKVVVFDSADPEYFIAHYDLARAGEKPRSPRESDLPPFIQFTTRLANAPVVSIAEVRGRARGVGSEFTLACDMRFAATETAIFGQPEIAVGLVPGGGATERLPRLAGRARALEIILGGDDFDAATAERYGWINRALPGADLGGFVENLVRRISAFDKQAIAEAKRLLNRTGLPDASELLESQTVFVSRGRSTGTRERVSKAVARGFGKPGDFERHLGREVALLDESIPSSDGPAAARLV